jgi:hypothetical protein
MVRSEQGAGKDRLIGTSAPRRRVRSALAEVGRTSPLRKKLPLAGSKSNFRGRDASYLAPPAQIRTGPIRAHGSHLGCLTAKRLSGHG